MSDDLQAYTTSRTRFSGVFGGKGRPVLLLHGYPQSHACWHAVAPALATCHIVIVPDLPRYGDSRTLDAGPLDKRSIGIELVAMMRALGHERFAVIGHDRGARVGYPNDFVGSWPSLSHVSAAVRKRAISSGGRRLCALPHRR